MLSSSTHPIGVSSRPDCTESATVPLNKLVAFRALCGRVGEGAISCLCRRDRGTRNHPGNEAERAGFGRLKQDVLDPFLAIASLDSAGLVC